MLSLGNILKKELMCFHCYADDAQLPLSIIQMKPIGWLISRHVLRTLKKNGASHYFLLLNSDKAALIVLGTKHISDSLSHWHILSQEDAEKLGFSYFPCLRFFFLSFFSPALRF